jgi:hypothetical protein
MPDNSYTKLMSEIAVALRDLAGPRGPCYVNLALKGMSSAYREMRRSLSAMA